jgi:hypothetical protein
MIASCPEADLVPSMRGFHFARRTIGAGMVTQAARVVVSRRAKKWRILMPRADYAKSINSTTYEKVGQSIFPHDHYAFCRKCPTVRVEKVCSAIRRQGSMEDAMRGAHKAKEMKRRASQRRATHKARQAALRLRAETRMAAVEARNSKAKIGSKARVKSTVKTRKKR